MDCDPSERVARGFDQPMNRWPDHPLPGEAMTRSSHSAVTHHPISVIGGLDLRNEET
jgi:hypothetical protein